MVDVTKSIRLPKLLADKIQSEADKNDRTFSAQVRVYLSGAVKLKNG